MRQTIYKLLLLGFVAAFMSAGSIDLLAKQPATPIRVGIKVDIMESSPVQGNITLTWVDGDRNNDLGNYFRITQYKKVDGKETEERVGKVERTSKGEYKFIIENLAVADYCYTIDLYDEKNDVASEVTERVCGKIAESTPEKVMTFNVAKKFIQLDENGEGKFFVGVKNETDCDYDIIVLKNGYKTEVEEITADGAWLNIKAEDKGQYTIILALRDKCKNSMVDKVELQVCYGDCINTVDKGLSFIEEEATIKLDDYGVGKFAARLYNDTDCDYEVKILDTDVKIEVSEQGKEVVILKIISDEKGNHYATLGLINKCTGELTSKLALNICYGDCDKDTELNFSNETYFDHKIRTGEYWEYEIKASSQKGCKISYYLSDDMSGNNNIPEGLKINEETGLMSWENPQTNEDIKIYKVTVLVKSTCDEGKTYTSLSKVFNLIVYQVEPDYTSTLKCNFSDETDDIKDFFGKVTVWNADQKDPGVPPTNDRKTFTAELNGTSVSIKLPTGKYYLRADVKGYKSQYYETAFELINAKTIGVGENETVEVSMMLHSIPVPKYFVVSGQVTDAATGEPLSAVVTFQSVKSVLGGNDSDHDNINFKFDNRVKTDEKGNYSIKLPDTYTYYANANSIMNSTQYKLQWYEGADSYYEADIIYLDSDKGNINFKLETAEATQGYMSGTVADKEGNVVQSTVIALHKADKSDYKVVTKTDEKGNFSFGNMKYGDYVVLSLPVENSYIPGYYVEDDYTTLKWKSATLVNVGDFAPTPEVNIIHAASNKDRAKGIARIKGHVRRIAKGIVPGGNDDGSDEEAISGGLVYLTNDAGDVVSYFVSDVDGSFELEGLEPGTYTLGIDKFGFDAYSEEVIIDYSENIEVETEIALSQVTTSIDYLDFGTAKLLVSPMPVTNISRVSFDGKAGLSNIKLVDMTGNVVYQTSLNTVNGNNNFDLDAKNITAGTYILVIENEEKSVAGSITIIK
ncbi:MAG: carboxypeptidase regulatory-like domain-containing protein [Candidatus Kapaibacterium sp.]